MATEIKQGDKVSLKGRPEVTGSVLDITAAGVLVEYDGQDWIPPRDWHRVHEIDIYQIEECNLASKCECGAEATYGKNIPRSWHTDYCPKH